MKICDYETLREKYPNTMPLSTAAGVLGTTTKRLESSISLNRLEFSYVINLSMPEDSKPHYRIVTERFIAHMSAIDMQSIESQTYSNEKMVKEIVSSVFKQLAGAI